MKLPYNILIAGIGGQGVVLTGEFLSHFFMEKGYVPNSTKMHGFSQRGGSVLYFLRIHHSTLSPLIENGQCHALICFNDEDSLRYSVYLSERTSIYKLDSHIDKNLPHKKVQNMALIGQFMQDCNKKGDFDVTFEELASFMKKSITQRLEENMLALSMGYHG